jgi:hypothetical protein
VFALSKIQPAVHSSSNYGKAIASYCFLIGRLTGNPGPAGQCAWRAESSRLRITHEHMIPSAPLWTQASKGGRCVSRHTRSLMLTFTRKRPPGAFEPRRPSGPPYTS